MLTRRKLLQFLPSLPFVGGFVGGGLLPGSEPSAPVSAPYRDYFKELGLRTYINAAGTYTALTGSLMPEEVTEAIQYAARQYVRLDDIQDKVGERIAALLRCEAATVTAGAASAMTLGTAGVLTGMVLTFAHTMGEFGVVLMVGGNIPAETRTISIAIYDRTQAFDQVAAGTMSLVLLGFAFVTVSLVYAVNQFHRRKKV